MIIDDLIEILEHARDSIGHGHATVIIMDKLANEADIERVHVDTTSMPREVDIRLGERFEDKEDE